MLEQADAFAASAPRPLGLPASGGAGGGTGAPPGRGASGGPTGGAHLADYMFGLFPPDAPPQPPAAGLPPPPRRHAPTGGTTADARAGTESRAAATAGEEGREHHHHHHHSRITSSDGGSHSPDTRGAIEAWQLRAGRAAASAAAAHRGADDASATVSRRVLEAAPQRESFAVADAPVPSSSTGSAPQAGRAPQRHASAPTVEAGGPRPASLAAAPRGNALTAGARRQAGVRAAAAADHVAALATLRDTRRREAQLVRRQHRAARRELAARNPLVRRFLADTRDATRTVREAGAGATAEGRRTRWAGGILCLRCLSLPFNHIVSVLDLFSHSLFLSVRRFPSSCGIPFPDGSEQSLHLPPPCTPHLCGGCRDGLACSSTVSCDVLALSAFGCPFSSKPSHGRLEHTTRASRTKKGKAEQRDEERSAEDNTHQRSPCTQSGRAARASSQSS